MANVLAHGIDCYSPLTASHFPALHEGGIDFGVRYLGAFSMGWAKGVTPAEVKLWHDNHMALVLNWEGNPTYPAYFTSAQAQQDAAYAVADAQWLHAPYSVPLVFSVDLDAQAADMPRIIEYFRSIVAHVKPYKWGVYGSHDVIDAILNAGLEPDLIWQTVAWSRGLLHPRAHIYQAQCDVSAYGMHVDIDEVYIAPTHWWEAPKSHPILQQGDTGASVRYLQRRLNKHDASPRLTVDGQYGPLTQEAVIQFQYAQHLSVTGICDESTWNALIKQEV